MTVFNFMKSDCLEPLVFPGHLHTVTQRHIAISRLLDFDAWDDVDRICDPNYPSR